MSHKEMRFRKSLAIFYHKWFRDCHDSAVWCESHGDTERANQYLSTANVIFDIIINNWDAVEFFSVGDRAFLIDSALPVEFRNYE